MKEIIIRKLKSISTPWSPGLAYQTNKQIPFAIQYNNHCQFIENGSITEVLEDIKHDEKFNAIEVQSNDDKYNLAGNESVILYTTSLRGIRKTFEDCNAIRFLLESFRVVYSERDVSMHLEYREELWRILGGKVIPPRIFIRGKYIGGADEIVGLHERGMLRDLLKGIRTNLTNCPCRGCGGMRFMVCSICNGSRKVVSDGEKGGLFVKCGKCNENGLVKCLICS